MIRVFNSMLILLLTTAAVSSSELPRFNIEATCRAAPAMKGGVQDPYPSCVRDEEAALSELNKIWTTYKAERRTECVSFGKIGDAPSYVEVLTCLQMYAADKPRGAQETRQ